MTAIVERLAGIDRFDVPLYTVAETARYLGVPTSTLASWARDDRQASRDRRDVVERSVFSISVPAARGEPSVPFVGLVEGVVLAALRRSGAPLWLLRSALSHVQDELGVPHVLASQRFSSEGPAVLDDHGRRDAGSREVRAIAGLVAVQDGQRVFNAVVRSSLDRIVFGPDGYASVVRLPAYEVADVVVDPTRGFGQPVFSEGGARLDDALAMFRAGEPLDVVAAEFGVGREHLEDAVRVATRTVV